jgi:hypothetical protein
MILMRFGFEYSFAGIRDQDAAEFPGHNTT